MSDHRVDGMPNYLTGTPELCQSVEDTSDPRYEDYHKNINEVLDVLHPSDDQNR